MVRNTAGNITVCSPNDAGLPELAQCQGWVFWSGAVGVSSDSTSFVVEYIFFGLFSVGLSFAQSGVRKLTWAGSVRRMRLCTGATFCAICQAEWDT